MYKNILLTGESGCGKSTLINKILDDYDIQYSGYRTLKYYINGVDKGFYLHGYVEIDSNFSPISIKTSQKSCISITESFQTLGVEILQKSRECKATNVILLDEIGTLETKAENFKSEIIKTLDCEKLVLGVLKKKENDFIKNITKRKDTLIINVEEYPYEEREELFLLLIENIKNILDKRDKYENI